MTTGMILDALKRKAEYQGVSMAELGRRGGLKAAANRKRKQKLRHSDECIASMWWNKDD